MLDAVGEFDGEGCTEWLGAKHTASWLARELRVSEATSFEYVFVARGFVNVGYSTVHSSTGW